MNRLSYTAFVFSNIILVVLAFLVIESFSWIRDKNRETKPAHLFDSNLFNVVIIIVFILTTLFSNKSVLHMFGIYDIWSLEEGKYTYYADMHYTNYDTGTENDYYLPVELTIEEDGDDKTYDVTKIYFNNGGEVDTYADEYVYDYKEPIDIYELDHPAKTYTVYLSNKKAPEHSGDTSLIYINDILVLIVKLAVGIIYIGVYLYYLGYKSNKGECNEN